MTRKFLPSSLQVWLWLFVIIPNLSLNTQAKENLTDEKMAEKRRARYKPQAPFYNTHQRRHIYPKDHKPVPGILIANAPLYRTRFSSAFGESALQIYPQGQQILKGTKIAVYETQKFGSFQFFYVFSTETPPRYSGWVKAFQAKLDSNF